MVATANDAAWRQKMAATHDKYTKDATTKVILPTLYIITMLSRGSHRDTREHKSTKSHIAAASIYRL